MTRSAFKYEPPEAHKTSTSSLRLILLAVEGLQEDGQVAKRADLAEWTGLCLKTVKRLVPVLLADGWLSEPVRGVLVFGDTMYPAGDTMSPVGDTMSPAGDTMSPVGDTMSPVGDTMSPEPEVQVLPPRNGPPDGSPRTPLLNPPFTPPTPIDPTGAGGPEGDELADDAGPPAAVAEAADRLLSSWTADMATDRRPVDPRRLEAVRAKLPRVLQGDALRRAIRAEGVRRVTLADAEAVLADAWAAIRRSTYHAESGLDLHWLLARPTKAVEWAGRHRQAQAELAVGGRPQRAPGRDRGRPRPGALPVEEPPPPLLDVAPQGPAPAAWVTILDRLRQALATANVEAYLEPLAASVEADGVLRLTCDDPFPLEWTARHYQAALAKAAAGVVPAVLVGDVRVAAEQVDVAELMDRVRAVGARLRGEDGRGLATSTLERLWRSLRAAQRGPDAAQAVAVQRAVEAAQAALWDACPDLQDVGGPDALWRRLGLDGEVEMAGAAVADRPQLGSLLAAVGGGR